jgi:hypothetical protein
MKFLNYALLYYYIILSSSLLSVNAKEIRRWPVLSTVAEQFQAVIAVQRCGVYVHTEEQVHLADFHPCTFVTKY